MKRQLCTTVLLAGCLLLATGCPKTTEQPGGAGPAGPTPGTTTVSQEQPGGVAQAVEPSLRYLPLDAPEGVSKAVVVQGHPLVHTRQLLPVDKEGNLAGDGNADQQIEQVLANLQAVLETTGSGLDKLVRLNVYADSPATVDLVRKQLAAKVGENARPAFTAVITPLPVEGAVVAVDAVAVSTSKDGAVALKRCDTVAGNDHCADAAIMPVGEVVYLSGQPSKRPLAEAAADSLGKLQEVLQQLKLKPSQVVQLKVFLEPASQADQVLEQIRRAFPDQLVPPVTFVEWIASAPVEIEMVVHRTPPSGAAESVEYYTPPGVKPSPTFSRVALVHGARQIYISTLTARTPGNGEAQVRDLFEQLKQILDESGSDLQHLAKATYYVSDEDASKALNKLRPEYYDPKRPPAASKATVHGVGAADRTVSMDMIAVGTGP